MGVRDEIQNSLQGFSIMAAFWMGLIPGAQCVDGGVWCTRGKGEGTRGCCCVLVDNIAEVMTNSCVHSRG